MDVYSLTDQQRRCYQSQGYPDRQTRRKQNLYSPSLKAHRPTNSTQPVTAYVCMGNGEDTADAYE